MVAGFTCHLFIISALLLWTTSESATIYYDFVITRKFVSPDGYEKSGLVINDELIGPTIEAFVGDSVHINVTNHGTILDVVIT